MNTHGESIVTLEGNVIQSRLKGSFNEAGCLAYTHKVIKIVTQIGNVPFAMLIDDLELEGGTPEAYAVLNQYNEWLTEQKIVAKALLVKSLVQKEIMIQHSPSITSQNIEFFTDRKKALKWLSDELALYEA